MLLRMMITYPSKASRLQGIHAAPGGTLAESFDNLVTLTRHMNNAQPPMQST
jgi:hypothetical protein